MKTRYVYDARKSALMVYVGNKLVGGYVGGIADRKFEELLQMGVDIELGDFSTPAERRMREVFNIDK